MKYAVPSNSLFLQTAFARRKYCKFIGSVQAILIELSFLPYKMQRFFSFVQKIAIFHIRCFLLVKNTGFNSPVKYHISAYEFNNK